MSLANRLFGAHQQEHAARKASGPGGGQEHSRVHDQSRGHGHVHGHGHGHGSVGENADTPGITLNHGRTYDTFTDVFFGGRRPAVFRELVRLSGAQPGDRALDVGCGTGYLTSMLGAAVAPEGSAVGVDASAAMVAEAGRLRSSTGATYTVGAAEHLEFDDGAFDLVASSLMIHHLPAGMRDRALREMHRVLRPGGRLLIAEFRPPRTRLGRRVVGALTGPAMIEDQRLVVPGLIRQAGFENLRTGDLHPWITYATAVRG